MSRRTALTATLHAALPSADGAAPDWVQLLPKGPSFSGADGRGPYRVDDPEALIAASMQDGPLVIDEAHATDHGLKTGIAAPAQGWITALEARADGLWGKVEWTPLGAKALADRLYRGLSPVFAHSRDGRVLQLLRAALTNAPNLKLAALNAQEGSMDMLSRLRALLGQDEAADEAAILSALEGRLKGGTALQSKMAVALGLVSGASETEIVTALQARVAGATEADKMRGELVALQAQVTTMKNAQATERATAVVDAAIRDGKPIPKTLRDHYIARHAADPASVEKELAALPSLHAGGTGGRPPAAGADPADDSNPIFAAHAIAAEAQKLVDAEVAAGRSMDMATAVTRVRAKTAAA